MIRLYNSLVRQVQDFEFDPKFVSMYVCGPTVYSTPHIGNARTAVIFDVLFRVLGASAQVYYARNYTDIDDKIIERSASTGVDISEITNSAIREYEAMMTELAVLKPTFTPRATGHIPSIIKMVETLIAKGHAYEAEGHVLFDIASWPSHGALTGHRQEDLDAGHRVAVADYKRSPGDFVLWKPSNVSQPGWRSPWGRGRPGWHIECSAMIRDIFGGLTVDIHGGGADLRFPHHECEISQSTACDDHPPARFWVHSGMLTVNGQKMAKSLGNIITVDQAVAPYGGQAARLALLMSHYRSNLDWTDELLATAHRALLGWHETLEAIPSPVVRNEHSEGILDALHNDLNTPLAIARIHEAIGTIANAPEEIASGVRYAASVMGLNFDNEEHDRYLRGIPDRAEIEALIAKRIEARAAKDFAESDRIRHELVGRGLAVEDGARGVTRWRRA